LVLGYRLAIFHVAADIHCRFAHFIAACLKAALYQRAACALAIIPPSLSACPSLCVYTYNLTDLRRLSMRKNINSHRNMQSLRCVVSVRFCCTCQVSCCTNLSKTTFSRETDIYPLDISPWTFQRRTFPTRTFPPPIFEGVGHFPRACKATSSSSS